MAVLGLHLFVPDLEAIPHETHIDSVLKQYDIKAKVVHTRDCAGEHSSGWVKVALIVVQNFLENDGLGGS